MLTQTTLNFLERFGYFSRYSKLYVRAIGPKKMPLDKRLTYDIAFRKGDKILPLSPMGEVTSHNFTYQNGLHKNETYNNPLSVLKQINKKPLGIYFTPCAGGQTIDTIHSYPALFYEIDNLSKMEQWKKVRKLEVALSAKLMVVETLNSLHVYIILDVPLTDGESWIRLQRRLIQRQQSDCSIQNPNRVMRLPGFDYWAWNEESQAPVTKGTIEWRQDLDRPLTLAQVEAALPEYDQGYWEPQPSIKARSGFTGSFNGGSDYWDIRNFALYLQGYNERGRGNWATAQCPHQGSGHSNRPSNDSLHISPDGHFKCHAGCDSRSVYAAALTLATRNGYPKFQDWLASQSCAEIPPSNCPAPPITEYPFEEWEAKKKLEALETSEGISPPLRVPEDTVKSTVAIKPIAEPLIPIPEPDNPALAHVHPNRRSDGPNTTLLGSAIRSLELSKDGNDLVAQYVWVFAHNEYYDIENRIPLKEQQLKQAYDKKVGFFKSASNWIQLPQAEKPKRVSVLDLLEAYDRQAFDYAYAPGEPALLPPVGKERFPRVNRWQPLPVGVPATEQDVQPWLERLYNLMPGERGHYFLQFLAFTVQQPAIKCDFAPLLYTEKRRSGREQLLAPVAALFKSVGQGTEIYCSSYDPRYTEELMGKRFVILNEMKRPTGREFLDPNHWLKNHIGHSADPNRVYTRKGLSSITMPDFCNFVLLTNEQDAITIMEDEGRYWPVETTWKGEESDYIALGRFYDEGGYAKVWGYLQTLDITTFSPWRPDLALSNFTEFCGATELDIRVQVLDLLEDLQDPYITHWELKQLLPHPDVQDGRPFRKLLANSQWTMGSNKSQRVPYHEGRTRIQTFLIHKKTMPFEKARKAYIG
jgi:hypothetical protein